MKKTWIKKILALLLILAVSMAMLPVQKSSLAKAAAKMKVTSLTIKSGGKNVAKKTIFMNTGGKKTLSVSTKPKAASKKASFKSSKPSVVSVSKKGVLTAKSEGTAKITITVSSKKYQKKTTWVKAKASTPAKDSGNQDDAGSQDTPGDGGSQDASGDSGSQDASGNNGSQDMQTGADTVPASGKKAAVLYYSASGTTRSRAQEVQKAIGEDRADLIEIAPKDVYTSSDLNWTSDSSRVTKEHAQTDANGRVSVRPELSDETKSVDLSKYDLIIIGYPIWWYDASWVAWSFLDYHKDALSGKRIVPFCTSASSSVDKSVETLKAFYPQMQIDGENAARLTASNAANWGKNFK